MKCGSKNTFLPCVWNFLSSMQELNTRWRSKLIKLLATGLMWLILFLLFLPFSSPFSSQEPNESKRSRQKSYPSLPSLKSVSPRRRRSASRIAGKCQTPPWFVAILKLFCAHPGKEERAKRTSKICLKSLSPGVVSRKGQEQRRTTTFCGFCRQTWTATFDFQRKMKCSLHFFLNPSWVYATVGKICKYTKTILRYSQYTNLHAALSSINPISGGHNVRFSRYHLQL